MYRSKRGTVKYPVTVTYKIETLSLRKRDIIIHCQTEGGQCASALLPALRKAHFFPPRTLTARQDISSDHTTEH